MTTDRPRSITTFELAPPSPGAAFADGSGRGLGGLTDVSCFHMRALPKARTPLSSWPRHTFTGLADCLSALDRAGSVATHAPRARDRLCSNRQPRLRDSRRLDRNGWGALDWCSDRWPYPVAYPTPPLADTCTIACFSQRSGIVKQGRLGVD